RAQVRLDGQVALQRHRHLVGVGARSRRAAGLADERVGLVRSTASVAAPHVGLPPGTSVLRVGAAILLSRDPTGRDYGSCQASTWKRATAVESPVTAMYTCPGDVRVSLHSSL